MDLVGLLAATGAVVGFPGGAYAVVAAGAAWTGTAVGGRRRHRQGEARSAWTPGVAAGLVALAMAAALLPLPGSPATELPARGAPQSLLALLLLAGTAVALLGPTDADCPRLLAAAAALVPVLLLCAVAASFIPAVVVNLPGPRADVARLTAGLAVVLATPLLAGAARGLPRLGLLAVPALLAFALAEPRSWLGAPGAVTAVAALGAAVVVGLLDPLAERPRMRVLVAAAAASAAIASSALSVSLL